MKWEKVKLGDMTDSCLGKMLDQQKNRGEFQPYLANVNVRWGTFDLDDLPQMRFEENEQERYGLRYGDLVVCEGGEPGRCAIWKEQIPNMKIQKALHRVRAHDGLDYRYLYYVTFRDKSPLAIAHHNFCTETAAKVKSVSDSSINLRIAINIAKMDNLKYYQEARDITSANKTVCSTLIILYRNITSVLKEIDKYLLTIDHSCENRFNWTIMRTTIQENYVSIFKAGNFEDFLKQGE